MSVLPGACGLCMGGASGLWALDEGDPPGKKPPGRLRTAGEARTACMEASVLWAWAGFGRGGTAGVC